MLILCIDFSSTYRLWINFRSYLIMFPRMRAYKQRLYLIRSRLNLDCLSVSKLLHIDIVQNKKLNIINSHPWRVERSHSMLQFCNSTFFPYASINEATRCCLELKRTLTFNNTNA
ncbi:CLUMA_CG013966, isoform A [Clunio marinus]|uniref:CLUMA_CG013966, isoform A n=1 Tax=Clunio marinus TaxID=568069 RepID=A0A1J1IKD8_9DIPT|nr:CLUMA_CG013966, isoform A [Clunio marinus]